MSQADRREYARSQPHLAPGHSRRTDLILKSVYESKIRCTFQLSANYLILWRYYCFPKVGQKSTTPYIPKNAFKAIKKYIIFDIRSYGSMR